MLVQCCATVYDGGPTLNQHWVNDARLLAYHAQWLYLQGKSYVDGQRMVDVFKLILCIMVIYNIHVTPHGDSRDTKTPKA